MTRVCRFRVAEDVALDSPLVASALENIKRAYGPVVGEPRFVDCDIEGERLIAVDVESVTA